MTDSPIFAAARAGDLAAVEQILAANPAAAGASDAAGLSVLTAAAYNRQWPVVERILATDPDLDPFEAAIVGDVDRLRALLDEADGEFRVRSEDGRTGLSGDAEDTTAPVDRRSADGFTGLHLAAFFGRPDVARLLLDRGADPNRWSTGDLVVQPLHSAVAGGDAAVTRLLVERGAYVNSAQQFGFTPLMGAAQNGQADTVALLLAHGADPKAYNADILTAAELADRGGHPEVAATIRAAGS